ncbi:MAG: fibronectin type III-like domain-contianing protein [Gemmatimonadota bacterium]
MPVPAGRALLLKGQWISGTFPSCRNARHRFTGSWHDPKSDRLQNPDRGTRGSGADDGGRRTTPGAGCQVTFRLGPDALRMLDADLQPVVEPGAFRVMIGASSEDIRLRGTFEVR